MAAWPAVLRLDPNEGFVQIGTFHTRIGLWGVTVAGHFTNTATTQIFNYNPSHGEAGFYEIHPTSGIVPIGRKLTGLPKTWKIYPSVPPRGEPTMLILRDEGSGVRFLRYDRDTILREIGARTIGSPGRLTQIFYGDFNGKGRQFAYYEPAIFNPTANALTDFDVCLARSQRAINTQIIRSWPKWMKEKIRIFRKRDQSGNLQDSKTGMEALVAPIQVELAEPNAKLDQVRVKVSMIEGSVTYRVDENLATYAFSSWEFSFLMSLDSHPVDMNFLAQIDPGAVSSAQAAIRRTGLPASAFSLECLFLKVTDTEARVDGNVTMTAPPDAPRDAQNVMASCINIWRQGEVGRFLLGTVMRRTTGEKAPTFAVTSLARNVHANFQKPDGSTLQWLGMMEGRPMPNLNQARTKLTDGWLRPPSDNPEVLPTGAMAISRNLFMDRYIIPKFSAVTGKQPVSNIDNGRPTWTFNHTSSLSRTTDDIIHRVWKAETTWTLRLAIEPHQNTISIDGSIVSQVDMDGYLHIIGSHTEWIHTRGRVRFSGNVTLSADYSKGYFALQPTLQYSFGPLAVEQDDVVGGAVVLNAFESVFRDIGLQGSTTAQRLGSAQRRSIEDLKSWLEHGLRNINLDLSHHAFIPPGGSVMAFRNPQFSQHGDLLFDVADE
jgi:hypothetical protein